MAKIVRPIGSNAGIIAFYRKRLQKELKTMYKSIVYWILGSYKRNEKNIVGDASPFKEIFRRFRAELRRWQKRWTALSNWLSDKIIYRTNLVTTNSYREAFKAAGFTVKLDPVRYTNDKVKALIAENVSLIRSIPQQFFSEIEGIVNRGIANGRDMVYIAEELGERYAVSQRRCQLIARDQIDKATQAIQRVHDEELGIKEGIWIHMPGRYTSRKTHIDMDGKRFKLFGPEAGLYDPQVDKKVIPGELILCRCRYSRVIPEFGD